MAFYAGVFVWSHAGGEFEVQLRTNGVFYCPRFPAAATWTAQATSPSEASPSDVIHVDWGKYGSYELSPTSATELSGSAVGHPDKWRKMTFLRAFTDAEALIMGEGGGSVWSFEWEKGSFEIEFRTDGFNHFVCPSYPAHSHWSFDGATGKVDIDWGKYGGYELAVDPASRTMSGSAKDNASKWRRATFLRPLTTQSLADVPVHDHGHVHDSNCGHKH